VFSFYSFVTIDYFKYNTYDHNMIRSIKAKVKNIESLVLTLRANYQSTIGRYWIASNVGS